MASARCLLLSLIGIFLFLAPAAAQAPADTTRPAGTEPILATDLFKIRELGDVAVSPDGRNVVYTVRQAYRDSSAEEDGEEGEAGYRTHLWLVPASGREAPRPLTRGEHSATDPQWHPDGGRLAFVRPVDGTPQVHLLPLAGGEPYPITDFEHGATQPRFSPDGSQLLFAARLSDAALRERLGRSPEWPSERPAGTAFDTAGATPDPDGTLAEVRAWLAQNRSDESPRVMNRLDFQGERGLEQDLTYRQLFVADVPSDPDALPEPTMLTQGFYDFGGGAWMADGRRVVFSGAPLSDRHPDRVRESDLYVVDADGQNFERLLRMENYALGAPTPAPEGGAVAFVASDLRDPGYAQSELGVLELDEESQARLLTLGFDRSVSAPQWAADGWHLYTVAASDGGFPLYRLAPFEGRDGIPPAPPSDAAPGAFPADTLAGIPTDTAAVAPTRTVPENMERLTRYARGIRAFDASAATVFYVVTEPTNPFELYANTTEFTRERRLTNHNADWLQGKRLSIPETFTVLRDTLEIQAWRMRPAPFDEGRRYPLLVEIHGGPSAMWGPGEATMWHEFQFFASHGYAIVYSNPRGSGGYGRDFKAANYRDWGAGPAGDVLAAANLVAAESWVDQSRQVVAGGSYAGYLVAWILGHTDRFKAAVAQRGVYDLATFLGEGNAWRLVPYHFGGYPWEGERPGTETDTASIAEMPLSDSPGGDRLLQTRIAPTDTAVTLPAPPRPGETPREALVRNSPLTYVDQIRTPLLIMHADEDLRTGVSQSEMLYKSLKALGRPVEYVRYPEAGHDLSRTGDPGQRLDRVLRIYEFFERHIGDGAEEASARR